MPRPMPRSTARCARRCAASTPTRRPISTTSSTITRRRTRRSARYGRRISARAASWSATRRRSRSTRCSAPTSGCAAGTCWRTPPRRCSSSTWTGSRLRRWRGSSLPPTPPLPLRHAALGALAAALLTAPAAGAAADFYAGKTIQLLIGFSAGGGYDIYGRTLARHMGRHIPGNPKVVTQNMPGAGSLKAVNYLYNVAAKDGTAIGGFPPGVVDEPPLGRSEGTQFEAPRFTWLGSISQEVSVCAFMASAGIKSWADMQTRRYVIGASGGGAESDVFPNVLRKLFNLPLKIVTGYP